MHSLVGRERIVGLLIEHLQAGRSVLLTGEAGMGKTAILRAAWAQRTQQIRMLYCPQASTVKAILKSLAEELCESSTNGSTGKERICPFSAETGTRFLSSRLSVRELRQFVLSALRSRPHALLLDHVGWVRGAYSLFLEELVDCVHVPIVATVRSLDSNDNGRLWWIGWTFQNIVLRALSAREARKVIEDTLDRNGVSLPDREQFITELVRLAKGNPRMIVRICNMAHSVRYQISGRTDLRLLHLDLRLRDLQDRIDAESPNVSPEMTVAFASD